VAARLNVRRLLTGGVIAGILAFSYFWGRRVQPPPAPLTAARVALLLGASERPEYVAGKTPYWRVRAGDRTLYAAESSRLAPDVKGYGGGFDLLVVIDESATVERLVLLRHRETASYLDDLKLFLASFNGLPADGRFRPGDDVDAMTRATVSSDAFARAARLTGRRLANAALRRDFPLPREKRPGDWAWAAGVAAAFAAATVLSRRPLKEGWRVAALAATAALFGFWGGRFISVGDIGRVVLFQFPPLVPRLGVYVLLAGAAVTALIWGNVYCGWLCPFGAVAELLYKIPGPKLVVPAPAARRVTVVRVAFLGAALGVIVATRRLGVAAYEPFDDLFAFTARGLALLFLIITLGVSVFHYRFFCRYLCAAGAAAGEVAAVGLRAGRVVSGGPCPAGAIADSGVLDAALCFECGRCRRPGGAGGGK
jgi:hypothetical protein